MSQLYSTLRFYEAFLIVWSAREYASLGGVAGTKYHTLEILHDKEEAGLSVPVTPCLFFYPLSSTPQ